MRGLMQMRSNRQLIRLNDPSSARSLIWTARERQERTGTYHSSANAEQPRLHARHLGHPLLQRIRRLVLLHDKQLHQFPPKK